MLFSPLHEVTPNASTNQTTLRGAHINIKCDDYVMIIIAQGVTTIRKEFKNAADAQNAPEKIIYEDNDGQHHFKKSAMSDNVVIWEKA